jgi:hypothetical protein
MRQTSRHSVPWTPAAEAQSVDVDELRKDFLRRMNMLLGEQYRCWNVLRN